MHAFFKTKDGGTLMPKPKPAASTSGKTKSSKAVPWVEKYRPQSVDEVSHQEEIVSVLKKSLQRSDLPNLLFYGPPGTGKTSTILAMARQLFGNELYKTRILELNASDERGIAVIREKVKTFAGFTAGMSRPDGKPCPAFKIIILDEADSMTNAAQAALRRTMEKHNNTTRFCLICNYVSRIIEPVVSRCAKFRFKPLSEDTMKARLSHICTQENVICDDRTLGALMTTSGGDLRKAITYLQSACRLKGDDAVTYEDIHEIAGVIPDSTISDVIAVCRSDSYAKLDSAVKGIIRNGYSAMQLVTQMSEVIIGADDISDTQKSVITEKMAVVDKCLMDGADEYLQLMDLGCVVMRQMCHSS